MFWISIAASLVTLGLLSLISSGAKVEQPIFWSRAAAITLALYATVPFWADPAFYRGLAYSPNTLHGQTVFFLQVLLVGVALAAFGSRRQMPPKAVWFIASSWVLLVLVSASKSQDVVSALVVAGVFLSMTTLHIGRAELAKQIVNFGTYIALTSIAFAFLKPELAWVTSNQGRGILSNGQLAGVMPMPNSLAIVTGFALLAKLLITGQKRSLGSRAQTALLFISCLFTASRTGLMLLVLFVLASVLGRLSRFASRGAQRLVILISAAAIAAIALTQEALFSLNGRDTIWSDTIRLGMESPVWGSGLEWANQRLVESGAFLTQHVGQAHNQFLDQFLRGGFLGVLLITGFFLVSYHQMQKYGFEFQNRAIWWGFFLTCMSEAIIHPNLGPITFPVWGVILLLCYDQTLVLSRPSTKASTIFSSAKLRP